MEQPVPRLHFYELQPTADRRAVQLRIARYQEALPLLEGAERSIEKLTKALYRVRFLITDDRAYVQNWVELCPPDMVSDIAPSCDGLGVAYRLLTAAERSDWVSLTSIANRLEAAMRLACESLRDMVGTVEHWAPAVKEYGGQGLPEEALDDDAEKQVRRKRRKDFERGRTTTRPVVLARDGATCSECGTAGDATNPIALDHIISLYKGGTNDPSNLRPLCRSCNSRKGAR